MKRFGSLLGLFLILLVLALAACGEKEEPPQATLASQAHTPVTTPLLTMLARVPDDLPDTEGWASVWYVDFQAFYVAEGIDELRSGDIETLLESVPLPGMMTRIVAGPQALQSVFGYAERMPEVVGFNWFSDVNRSIEYGTLPHMALILEGSFDEEIVSTALQGRGFELRDVEGVSVWHRFDDAATHPEAIEPADPFGGSLGMAARIAMLPGYLVNSRYWEMTEAAIATAQGAQSSLADDANYQALAEAITNSEGLLLQAMFFNAATIGVRPENLPPGISEAIADYGELKPYALAVLADRQEGQDQVHLIGLVYPDMDQAQAAAQEVASRIRTFSLPQQSGDILVERFNAQVTASVYESTTSSNVVALVEVRYPLPADRTDPQTGGFIAGGPFYRAWSNAIIQRAFSPLWIK